MRQDFLSNRTKSISELIMTLRETRGLKWTYLNKYVPGIHGRVMKMAEGKDRIGLDAFINLLTAMRCDLVVIPRGMAGKRALYILNEFPDDDGRVLVMPKDWEMHRDGAMSAADRKKYGTPPPTRKNPKRTLEEYK